MGLADIKIHHIHLVSDATGETINGLTRAALAQFRPTIVKKHSWLMVRSPTHLEEVVKGIERFPGLVLSTFGNMELRHLMERACLELNAPHIGVMDGVLNALSAFFQLPIESSSGRQHALDEAYFRRIEAMDYALDHDDGQGGQNLAEADVVLVGVSRTSKTPTCLYLANRGIKAANVPLVPGLDLPERLLQLQKGTLVVGLVSDPAHLVEIRRSRLRQIADRDYDSYTQFDTVNEEMQAARKLFRRQAWPVIDVTRRSIEETAAEIVSLYERKLELSDTETAVF